MEQKLIKNKRKTLPIELLVDIFNGSNSLFSKELKFLNKFFKLNMARYTHSKYKKYLYNYGKNLLTSSSIVNMFLGESF
uniref:Uncharacterized protein n=1 Tax=Meloidogyne enterolobii TaxID=390850 RepID=A0A6V7X7M1_MELEN|nr:unnamed protein product [Meloidogyne enterolobii]